MRFGPVPPDDAVGAILVHSVRLKGAAFKKGRILSTDDVAALKAAGIEHVTAAAWTSTMSGRTPPPPGSPRRWRAQA